MKCSGCGREANRKERVASSGRCPACGLVFVFDPYDVPVTDFAFADAMRVVSSDGRLRWGVEHLYYEICRRLDHRRRRSASWMLMLIGIVAMLAGALLAGAVGVRFHWFGQFDDVRVVFGGVARLGAIVGACGVTSVLGSWWLWRNFRTPLAPLAPRAFDAMWSRWVSLRPPPRGVIVRRQAPTGPYRAVEPDVGDYSFDRAVICDRARTVDLLLANNFHFEQSCAVLSVNGYPGHAFETVRKMLMRNRRLRVCVLHDATVDGCTLAHRLAQDPGWFAGRTGADAVSIVDVGVGTREAKTLRGLYQAATTGRAAPAALLSSAQRRLLGRYALELAAVRPESVLRATFRALTALPRPIDDDVFEPDFDVDDFG